MTRGYEFTPEYIERMVEQTRAKMEAERKYAAASEGQRRTQALARMRRVGRLLRKWEARMERP